MTLVHENAAVVGPATHVLIIGVGRYPYLPGGDGPHTTPYDDNMRQLSSPPISARLMCDWFIENFSNDQRPLATIDLLLADGAQTYDLPASAIPPVGAAAGGTIPIEAAELDSIGQAVFNWKQRGDSHPDNLMIFYFCGHGISSGTEMALVSSDYGANIAGKPLEGLIDFRRFLQGMENCAAKKQCYFIDACRSSSDSLTEARNFYGDELLQAMGKSTRGLQQCVYYSTLAGETAHARPGQPSLFTGALVRALAGAGASNTTGPWRITTIRLFEALNHFMLNLIEPDIGVVQVPQSGTQTDFDIHVLPGDPEVPVLIPVDGYVGAAPPAAVSSLAVLSGQARVTGFPCQQPPDLASCEWRSRHFETWLRTGIYDVELTRTGGGAPQSKSCFLTTPGRIVGFGA